MFKKFLACLLVSFFEVFSQLGLLVRILTNQKYQPKYIAHRC